MLRLSLKMTGRDWRAGQLRFLLVALIVAVGLVIAADGQERRELP